MSESHISKGNSSKDAFGSSGSIAPISTGSSLPLCVDLDGTFTPSDLLVEHVLLVLKRNPLLVFLMPFWLLSGRMGFKNKILNLSQKNPQIPIQEDLLAYLKSERFKGRSIFLVTASPLSWARQVSELYPQLFEGVMGSDSHENLKGPKKAKALVERFGLKGFVYAGNSRVDFSVFEKASMAVPVGTKSFAESVGKAFRLETQFVKNLGWSTWFKAIRVHQWSKNVLIFVPMFLAHKVNALSLTSASLAFFSFSLMASSIYILNDLLDLESDRLHPKKNKRPFASGALSPIKGLVASLFLIISSLAIGSILPFEFLAVLLAYFVLTTLYSFYLKSKLLFDVVTLTSLFTVRVYAGSAATEIHVSEWLLAFSLFFFFSLALVKRYVEILKLKELGRADVSGRAYKMEDSNMIMSLGTSSGLMAVLVITIYLNQAVAANLYTHPKWLLAITALMMYWISRVWILAQRGEVNDDPIVFALKDRQSIVIGILAFAVMWIAAS